jgi:hypothetical protein
MPAKNKRARTAEGNQANFATQVEASRQAHAWAAKSLMLREAGKRFEADRAKEKARHWLRKAMALAPKVDTPQREGGKS